jgi:hypothetical protein
MSKADFFFQPIEFDLQLANLLGERRLQRFLLRGLGAPSAAQQRGPCFQRHLLPLGHLPQMYSIIRRNFIDRPFPPQRFQDHLGFALPTVLSPLYSHRLPAP